MITRIDWKARLRNKATLVALIAASIAFIYQIFGIMGKVPPISQDELRQALGIFVNILGILGIVVDPTTPGITDTE